MTLQQTPCTLPHDSSPSIRTLLVDDSPAFIETAARFLAMDPRIEIVERALSGREALEQIGRLSLDLVVMDLAMPGMDGLEATRQIKAQPGAPRVVIVTMHDNAEYRAAARLAGADGFIAKSDFGTQLLPAILALFAGPERKGY